MTVTSQRTTFLSGRLITASNSPTASSHRQRNSEMGGSRRRLKRNLPKVKVGVIKRKKNVKAQVPLELLDQRDDVHKRLNSEVEWTEQQTLTKNYKANKFVLDPNEGFGRNSRSQPLKAKEQREAEDGETYSDDDELRVACNKERKSGKAPPQRLSSHQRQMVQRLVDKHGDNVEAMFRDRKLNPMQHSLGKLRELLASFAFWPEGSRQDFRAPHKPPKKPLVRGICV